MSDDRIFAKAAWRLMPLIIIAYIINYLDRTNVGFAALTMNRELGFSPSVYGFGAGLFFFSYSLFQVPANLTLHRVGARRWIFCILAAWGAAAASGALIDGQYTLYAQRFFLGVAEAGFFPGIILYLTFWFPKCWLGRTTAMFMAASQTSMVISGPLASFIMGLDGAGGITGWQWLFLVEGLPACLLAPLILKGVPDGPARANWLSDEEKRWIAARLQSEESAKERNVLASIWDMRVLALGIAYGGILIAIYGLNFWLPLLIQQAGFPDRQTGFVTALVYLLSVPAMILWGRSSDRRDERTWHVVMPAVLAAAGLSLASIASNSILMLTALAAGAIGLGAVLAPFYMLAPLFLSGPAMAGGFAFVSCIGGLIGGFAGQYVIGELREWSGGYALVLAAMAVALLVTAIIVLALDRAIVPRAAVNSAPAE
jgi:ACS family tartrate transporter-like MFS transporter